MEGAQRRIANISKHLTVQTNEQNQVQTQETSADVLREFLVYPRKANTKSIPVSELKSSVGKELGVSEWFQITQDRVNAFADATGDHQWIHVDVERAKAESPFGGPIAHGFLTLSLIPMLVFEAMPKIEGVKMALNYGLNKVRFISPVAIGGKVRARVSIAELTEVQGGLQLVSKVVIEKEGDQKPSASIEWITRYYL